MEEELSGSDNLPVVNPRKSLNIRVASKPLGILLAIVILWLPLLAYHFLYLGGGTVNKGSYQAVFLTNGQVYFGKLDKLHTDYPVLTDIYYLIVTRPLQSQQTDATGSAQQTQPDFSLRKLGQELHGPEDRMVINKRHILFVEDLKNTGQVVEAIRQYTTQVGEPQGSAAPPVEDNAQ